MHELAVCQSLLSEVGRVAAKHDAAAVTQIVVAVGPLSAVEPALLQRAFGVARAGTIASEASLMVEVTPVVVWCDDCQAETAVAPNALLCATCGTWQVSLRSGNELLLKSVELARTSESTDAAVC